MILLGRSDHICGILNGQNWPKVWPKPNGNRSKNDEEWEIKYPHILQGMYVPLLTPLTRYILLFVTSSIWVDTHTCIMAQYFMENKV